MKLMKKTKTKKSTMNTTIARFTVRVRVDCCPKRPHTQKKTYVAYYGPLEGLKEEEAEEEEATASSRCRSRAIIKDSHSKGVGRTR
jgi:hypothetical protein